MASNGDGVRAAYESALVGPHAQHQGLDAQDLTNYQNEYMGEERSGACGNADGQPDAFGPCENVLR